MSLVTQFQPLDKPVLGQIFRHAGEFSKLARVCVLFSEVVKEEAEKFYEGLCATYGKTCLLYVLKMNGLESDEWSKAAKIDGLFCAVLRLDLEPVSYNPHTLNELKAFMEPYLHAEALAKVWGTLMRTGPASLRELMKGVKFGDDPLKNAVLIRDFFKAHPEELAKVETLNLSNKQIRVFPLELCCFTKLQKLDLSGNALTVVPQEIGLLKGLKDLRFNSNFIKELPDEIGALILLENFQCSSNRLESVPESICGWNKLRTLNLSRNGIRALPEKINGLQALNYLYLESNRLSCLPSSIGSIPYLVGLYLFGNQIAELPGSLCFLEHLKYLSAQNNQLTQLPENIGTLSRLTTLLLDNNNIHELPASICALQNLMHFFISGNQITERPEGLHKLELFYCGTPKGVLNPGMTQAQFEQVYWGLGENKWKECIDGYHHVYGQEVYDKGLHGRSVEPGFLGSMVKGFIFISDHANQIVDADFYLELHKKTCSHFKGKDTCTLMGQEKVGVFRDYNDTISAGFCESTYLMTDAAIKEFLDLNMKISLLFGSSFRIGDIVMAPGTSKSKTIYYFPMSKEQVRILFNFFMAEFYFDIGCARNDDDKVRAIAKVIQRLEWLHSVRDGCGRTDTALLNDLLTCFGFNPLLLEYPYVSSCKGLDEWVALIYQGMEQWRRGDIK